MKFKLSLLLLTIRLSSGVLIAMEEGGDQTLGQMRVAMETYASFKLLLEYEKNILVSYFHAYRTQEECLDLKGLNLSSAFWVCFGELLAVKPRNKFTQRRLHKLCPAYYLKEEYN